MTFFIPAPTLAALASPTDGPVLLLIRHSVRGPLPPDEPGNDVRLLPEGFELAARLGAQIGPRLGIVHTSPVPRCVETAEAIIKGAGGRGNVVEDRLLGNPGAFVEVGGGAWETWQQLGHEAVMEAMVTGVQLPGLTDPVEAARRLVAHMHASAAERAGVHIFVTHDSLVTAAAAHCLGVPFGKADWPFYLEALALVPGGGGIRATYRGWSGQVPWA